MDAGDHAHGGKQGHDGGAAVADKGQSQADDGHDEQAHADVGYHLENQHGRNAYADIHIDSLLGVTGNEDAAQDNGGQEGDGKQAPQHPQFLTDDGENQVRVPGRKAPGALGLGLGAVKQALARELAAP